MGAADFQQPGAWRFVFHQCAEPVQVAFGKIRTAAGIDLRQPKIARLVFEPVLFSVQTTLVCADGGYVTRQGIPQMDRSAGETAKVVVGENLVIRTAAPAQRAAHSLFLERDLILHMSL